MSEKINKSILMDQIIDDAEKLRTLIDSAKKDILDNDSDCTTKHVLLGGIISKYQDSLSKINSMLIL